VVLVNPEAFGTGIEGAVDRYVAMNRATQQLVLLTPELPPGQCGNRCSAAFRDSCRHECKDLSVAGIRTDSIPQNIDGPALVAAASALMLLPENASRLLRLHRLAALGMALTDDGASPVSPSAIRSILKREDISGSSVLIQEDPYSEVLIHSISFVGGPYLVSPGTGEHTVADLENLLDAVFDEPRLPEDIRKPARHLIQGLLTISDMVLKRAGLTRGTWPGGSARTPINVPSAVRLRELTGATFISDDELDAHSDWLRIVVDTFALDPGRLDDPCAVDITDDRLYMAPFVRLRNGYRVALPLDLLITIRLHLLRFALQANHLEELGRCWRKAALRRFMRLAPSASSPVLLEENNLMTRYLLTIDEKRDLHVIVATDPLVDWQLGPWGSYDTRAAQDHIFDLVSPRVRGTYSSAEELLHLVITDSPGRAAFWGVPNVDDADPMLIARSDDLEVILHQEPDGLLGLLLFARAIQDRPGDSMSTDILDEYCVYVDHEKSFYFSDDRPPTFTLFVAGDGLYPRKKYHAETDRHGVIPPGSTGRILQASRRYQRDAPEIFLIEPTSSYLGYVVELDAQAVFIPLELQETGVGGVKLNLAECVAYWVRECATYTGARAPLAAIELVITLSDPEPWKRFGDWSMTDPAVRVTPTATGWIVEFTETFVALLHDRTNTAERELVMALLTNVFGIANTNLISILDAVAPLGSKRMITTFNPESAPDMLAERLPRPLTGHAQVTAQLLDELGEWLRSPEGGGFSIGPLAGQRRVRALNAAVEHLFERLEREVASYDQRSLLDFLIAQNESLLHDARFNSIMLRSRLACFGEQSHTVTELVQHQKESATAQRANRFLIEYVAARPPSGARTIQLLDYYRVLAIATEIIQRATTSDFLHYGLADFEVSILDSGRLGVSREEALTAAMDTYTANSGMRSVRRALNDEARDDQYDFDVVSFVADSEDAMRGEFGFTLTDLRGVCGALLDLATADRATRIDKSLAISEIASKRDISQDLVSAVLGGITLTRRSSFLDIGPDAWPWRFNRDMSYVRRPLVLQGNELVFGFRAVYRLGPYWVDNLLSGRLQGRAKTSEMQRCISVARGRINRAFAYSVSTRLQDLGMTTRVSVRKISKHRIVDSAGNDLGDIDVLAAHPESRSIIAVEAKDFEIARTPGEIANEFEKVFTGKNGKKSTIELHSKRIDWLRQHLDEVVLSLLGISDTAPWHVVGAVVTSDPLITPLVSASTVPVIPFDDLTLEALRLTPANVTRSSKKRRKRR
jgi:hypothetical protein